MAEPRPPNPEAGLVVALMWLDGSVYPADDARPALGVLEWIQ